MRNLSAPVKLLLLFVVPCAVVALGAWLDAPALQALGALALIIAFAYLVVRKMLDMP